MEYTKGPLPFDGQIKHLKSKWLSFADETKALHTLQHVSYFETNKEIPCRFSKSTKKIWR